jgi:Raf kinase inhibitor-like YbhB/YbcL family protein
LKQTSAIVAGGIALAALLVGPAAHAADPFMIKSSAFEDNGKLAVKNAGATKTNPNCVGENVSPPLSWSNPPAGTTSYALLMLDPEGRGGLGVSHWVAYGIPVSVTGFAEGEVSKQTDKYVGGKSTQGVAFYSGPCTPPGDWHHYTFTLIATDLDPKALQPGMTRDEVLKALDGHAKGAAGLIGRFTHPQ